jgi:hypothetical protein
MSSNITVNIKRGVKQALKIILSGDHTSRKLYLSMKSSRTASTVLISLKNTLAGGGDTQVAATLKTRGETEAVCYFLPAHTQGLTGASYFLDLLSVDASDSDDIQRPWEAAATLALGVRTLAESVTGNTTNAAGIDYSGDTATRTAVAALLTTSNKGFQFFDTDDNTPYFWNGTEFV